jgi:predicted Zn-dependent protease
MRDDWARFAGEAHFGGGRMSMIRTTAALALAVAAAGGAFAQEEARGPSGFGMPPGWQEHAAAIRAIEAKDYARAQRLATVASRLAPRNVDVLKVLGAAQMGGDDWPGAARTYSAVVRLDRTDPVAHAGLGVALARLNDPKAKDQLVWLKGRAEQCAGRCPDAERLAVLTGSVAAALQPRPGTSE